MGKLLFAGRCFFAIGIVGMGLQQFIYAEFRPVFLANWPASFPGQALWAYLSGALLIFAGIFILLNIKNRATSLSLAIFLLMLFLFSHVYYHLLVQPGKFELATWINPLKALALAGGALIIAAGANGKDRLFEKAGRSFFSIMLIIFGISHFVYTDFVVMLVPGWIPGARFWAYFSAIALIGSGLCLLTGIKIRLVAILCGVMLFLWFAILHIPRAIAYPDTAKGNELTSVFQALAFSGIAFVIAAIRKPGQSQ